MGGPDPAAPSERSSTSTGGPRPAPCGPPLPNIPLPFRSARTCLVRGWGNRGRPFQSSCERGGPYTRVVVTLLDRLTEGERSRVKRGGILPSSLCKMNDPSSYSTLTLGYRSPESSDFGGPRRFYCRGGSRPQGRLIREGGPEVFVTRFRDPCLYVREVRSVPSSTLVG